MTRFRRVALAPQRTSSAKAKSSVLFALIPLGRSRRIRREQSRPLRDIAWLLCFLAGFMFASISSHDAWAIPADDLLQSLRPTADVNDFAGVLTPAEKSSLEEYCRLLRAKNGAQLSVVVLKSLQGGQIDDFAAKLFKKWGIGLSNEKNGVLLLVAIEDRRARIEVGYGLEPILPDILAGQILRDDLFPAFKQQRYAAGLQATVVRIISIIEKNEPAQVGQKDGLPIEKWGFILVFLICLVSPPSYVAGNLMRFGSLDRALAQLPVPGIALLVSALIGMPWGATGFAVIAALFSAYLGYASGVDSGSSRGRRYRRDRNDWFGGPWIGSSGSGWSGGGFSGGGGGSWGGFGGGSSGGGGASGGW